MKRRRRLRWKAVLVFLALGGAISASGYALYRAQAREAVRAARDEAFRAAERGDTDDAIRLMDTYISVYRDDSAAVRDLALRLDSTSKQPGDRVKVLFALDRALQLNPGDVETRRLAVNRALELHRWKDAQDHLAVLVQDFPQDAELQRRLGECAEGQGDTDRAIAQYDRAIALDRLQVDAYARQARLLRSGKGQQEKADALMNELRRAAPESVPARLALARYFRESGRAGEAAGDLEAAVRKAPDMAEVRLEAALHEIALEHLPAAEAHVRAGLARNADYLPLVKLRVELERRSGKAPGNDVRDLVRQTLAILDTNPRKTADVLDLLIDVGELAAARDLLDGAQSAWLPGHLRDFLEARLRIAEEDYVRARELLERCRSRLAPSPELARYAHLLLGICQRRLGEPDQAAGSFRTALDITPAWAPAELELAAANVQRGQIEEAVAIYRGLMKVVPPARIVAARLMLHSILRRAPESRDWSPLEELLNEAPADLRKSDDWRLLHSELLSAQGKDSEARSELLAAIASDPKSLTCRLALAAVLSRQKDYAQAEESLTAAERECGDRVEIRLARANLARQREASSAGAVITGLMADRAKFGRADQVRLLSGLYHVAQQTDAGLTRLLAAKLTELQPGRIDLWFGMLRLALADNDEAAARGLLKKLREQEGEGGAYWR